MTKILNLDTFSLSKFNRISLLKTSLHTISYSVVADDPYGIYYIEIETYTEIKKVIWGGLWDCTLIDTITPATRILNPYGAVINNEIFIDPNAKINESLKKELKDNLLNIKLLFHTSVSIVGNYDKIYVPFVIVFSF